MKRYVIHRLIRSNRQKLKFLPHILKLAMVPQLSKCQKFEAVRGIKSIK